MDTIRTVPDARNPAPRVRLTDNYRNGRPKKPWVRGPYVLNRWLEKRRGK